jgi:hypothetical protein
MKPINTLPIEDFIDKARIASRTNQKAITLDIKEVTALSESLAVAMTRLTGLLDNQLQAVSSLPDTISVNMDGGGF